jgi:hypothetical protein
MQYQSATETSVAARPVIFRPAVARLLAGAALLCIFASANADQLLVTAANSDANSVYDLKLSPSSAVPVTPVISTTTTPVNSDGKNHGSFDALVWVSNSYCKSLDLIVADAAHRQIVRYSGASTLPNCYNPTGGTPTLNPSAQVIFTWTKLGSGPAQPNGLSADANGNLFVVSSSGLFDPKPSVWVLPFNQSGNLYCSGAAGTYCAPVLIDNKFSGVLTLALAETLVAGVTTPLWNAGDLLVLVGDTFDARLTVYSQGKIYGTNGRIATGGLPLGGPTSVAIPWLKFLEVLADPFGMDIWPANTSLGPNPSVLFTTVDGRILRFDTVQNKFVTNFASGLGFGLQKIKVGTYANIPYAFVAQIEARNTGQILALAAPTTGTNKPLAAVSTGVMNPMGLAVSNSASVPVPPPVSQNCTNCDVVIDPLGPVAVTTYTPPPGESFTGTVTEQNCIVQSDPRVSNGLSNWSCTGADLPIGSGTPYCPSFPSAIIPGSVCGHSGPTGSGFAVIEGTATGLDSAANNTFFETALSIDTVLPGPANLECTNFPTTGQIPLTAWGTRSDLQTVEGTMAEDSLAGFPNLSGAPGYLADLTGFCDTSTTGGRGISIFAYGVGLSNTSQSYVYALQNEAFEALQQTVAAGNIASGVQSTLETEITAAEAYVTAAEGGNNVTPNLDCALNEIYTTDVYLRANLSAFASNLVTSPPGGGNPNPAPDIDSRLAAWYLMLNTQIMGNQPPTPPTSTAYPLPFPVPASSVPACNVNTLYSVSGSATGLVAGGTLLVQDSNGDGLSETANSAGNASFAFPADLASGATYSVTVPSPPNCSVTNGAGVISNANITNVVVTCPDQPPVISNFFINTPSDPDPGYVNWVTQNATSCNITDLYAYSSGNGYTASGLPTGGPTYDGDDINYSGSFAPPSGAPGYGTDTYTLTCFGASGTTPATASILNASGAIPATTTPLTISSFTAIDTNGNLSWATTNSTTGTTCTITDAYGGTTPYTSPNTQQPITGLPASEASYAFPYFKGALCSVAADVLTLTCSDPSNGTAFQTLTLSNAGVVCIY